MTYSPANGLQHKFNNRRDRTSTSIEKCDRPSPGIYRSRQHYCLNSK
ncbi:MAG TPA: hypothetical protein V6D31_09055 [Candidatus Sericytochromatia bacterium]